MRKYSAQFERPMIAKQSRKKRFAVGQRVTKGIGKQFGTVVASLEQIGFGGEFWHEVILDGHPQPVRALGSELEAVPVPYADRPATPSTIHLNIQNSNIANLNLGSQVGAINAALESISSQGGSQQEFALAIKELTEAVVSQQGLIDSQKQEVIQVLATLVAEASKKPEERSAGMLKAVLTYIPTVISSASQLATIWATHGPAIKAYLNV